MRRITVAARFSKAGHTTRTGRTCLEDCGPLWHEDRLERAGAAALFHENQHRDLAQEGEVLLPLTVAFAAQAMFTPASARPRTRDSRSGHRSTGLQALQVPSHRGLV